MSTPQSPNRRAVKARILGLSLVDLAVDVLVPSIIALALTSAGVAVYLAFTAGGVVVGAKAALGRLADWRLDRHAAVVAVSAGVALAVLFGLPVLGVSDVLAAAAAGLVIAVAVLLALTGRARRVDGMGLLVLAEVAASVVVTLISDDPRFVLARPAAYTAVAGVSALVSSRWGRPLMLDATKPIASAGDPVRATAFESAWEHSPRFRAITRATTAGLGIMLLVEAVLRVGVVYTAANPAAALTGLLAQAPAVALFMFWVLAVRLLAVPRTRAIVDDHVAAATAHLAESGSQGARLPSDSP